MNRDQAAQIITNAIAPMTSSPDIEVRQHAAYIATALDALGLLNLGRLAYAPGCVPPHLADEKAEGPMLRQGAVAIPLPQQQLGNAARGNSLAEQRAALVGAVEEETPASVDPTADQRAIAAEGLNVDADDLPREPYVATEPRPWAAQRNRT